MLVCCRYLAVRLVYSQIRSVGCLYSTAQCCISAMLLHLTWNQSFSLCSEKQDSLWCIKYKGGKMWTILPSKWGTVSVFQHSLTLPPSQSPETVEKKKKCLAFLELAQVKQIMDLSLFITFVMQKPKSPALLLLKQSMLYSTFSEQNSCGESWILWWLELHIEQFS